MNIELLKNLPVDACKEGLVDLESLRTNSEAFDAFFKYIDFCLAKEYPDKEQLKQLEGHSDAGIIIDQDTLVINKERLVILGKSDTILNCSSFIVSRVYLKHDSQLTLCAEDNSFVMVDAHDNSQVTVEIQGNARVIVNLYGSATAVGATKIVKKNLQTYEL